MTLIHETMALHDLLVGLGIVAISFIYAAILNRRCQP